MVEIKRGLAITFLLSIAAPSIAAESCSFEEREDRTMQVYADRLLDRVPSMIQNCAMGGAGGIFSPTNDIERWLEIPDTEFFCGFGANDAWEAASREMNVKEARSLEHHVNIIYRSLEDGTIDYEIPIPGTSYQLRSSKAFRHIFKHVN